MYQSLGESNHGISGIRRGRMQACGADGMDLPAIDQLAQIKPSAVGEHYLDLSYSW